MTNHMDSDTISTSGADTATADASPDSSATSQSATPDSTATAQTSPDVSSATSGGAEAASSSPTDTRVAQDAQSSAAQTQAAVDYKKRYDELKGQYDRTVPQLRQYEQKLRQYDGVDPQAVAQWRQAQQRAQAEKLPRYAPQHPEHGAFRQLAERVKMARAAVARAPAEQKEAVRQAIAANFTDQELQEFDAWQNHQQQFLENFSFDAPGAINQMVAPLVQQAVQRALQEEQVRQQVAQQIQSNDVRPIIEKHGMELKRLMEEEQMSWPMALKFVQMQEQLGALSSTAGQAVALQASANAQFNQRKAAAAISADPKADRRVDPKVVAKERGISPSSPQYLDLLDELHSKGLLGPRA